MTSNRRDHSLISDLPNYWKVWLQFSRHHAGKGDSTLKKLLAIIAVTLLASLGIVSTAAATTEEERIEECGAAFDDGFFALTDHLDDVEFFLLVYDIEDLFHKFEIGQISEAELVAGLDALLPGLVDLFIEFFECVDAGEPVKPPVSKKPGPVPTSVPAGHDTPEGTPVASVAVIGLGAAGALTGLLLLRRRLVS